MELFTESLNDDLQPLFKQFCKQFHVLHDSDPDFKKSKTIKRQQEIEREGELKLSKKS